MIENIKNEIYMHLEMLFGEIAADKLTSDMKSYKEKIMKVASIAEMLGIETVITEITIDLKQ